MSAAAALVRQLAAFRVQAGLTQADVAQRMRVGRSSVTQIEDRTRSDYRLSTLQRYAAAIGVRLRVEILPGPGWDDASRLAHEIAADHATHYDQEHP